MTLIVSDRVVETTATTGTGDLTLAGAVTGYRRFSAKMSVGDTAYCTIEAIDTSGAPTGDWETGLYTYSAANTLTRTTVKDSSNSGSAVSFAAGTKRVYLNLIAAHVNMFDATEPARTAPKSADFTAVNASALTITDRPYGFVVAQAAAAGFQYRGYFKTAPTAPYSIYAKLDVGQVDFSNNCRVGIGVRNSATDIASCYGIFTSSGGTKTASFTQWNSVSSYQGDSNSGRVIDDERPWLRLDNDGTNLNFYIGDGYDWVLYRTQTIAAFQTTINQIGVIVQVNNPCFIKVLSFSTTAPV